MADTLPVTGATSLNRLGPTGAAAAAAVGLLLGYGFTETSPAASAPRAQEIRRHTFFLGSDACEGRAPGSLGSRRAAAYIAGELQKAGVPPVGDLGGYFQEVPMHGSLPLPASEFLLVSPAGTRSLRLGQDYVLHSAGHQTLLPQPVPVVFVGYGITAPEYDYNDYAGFDVRGRIVSVLDGEPPSNDDAFFAGKRPTVHATLESKRRNAIARGARGCLLIPDASGEHGATWSAWQGEYAFEHITLEYSVPDNFFAVLAPWAAEELFCGTVGGLADVRRAERSHALKAMELRVAVRYRGRFTERDFLGNNVIGRIQGADPVLSTTAVVVAAHYDHLGVGPPIGNDRIYNGVVDNALGVATVLEVARVVAALPERPRRSLLFLFTDGEERGLLGASYYTHHPIVPLHRTVGMINVDGAAHTGFFTEVVGIGGELSTIGRNLASVAAAMGLSAAQPPDGSVRPDLFRRSDQAAFAEAGVPAILVSDGLGADGRAREEVAREMSRWGQETYHSPFDDLTQPLNFEATRRYAMVLLALVLDVANDPVEPAWNGESPYALVQLQNRRSRR